MLAGGFSYKEPPPIRAAAKSRFCGERTFQRTLASLFEQCAELPLQMPGETPMVFLGEGRDFRIAPFFTEAAARFIAGASTPHFRCIFGHNALSISPLFLGPRERVENLPFAHKI